ncbi:class I SAM-dependent methyltransferase [Kitasatospora sp. NPDC087861]|uniref:class I SAM-dependent methyltransferase n=1 Tax=Kitasatospora sp. NPDC087861 TaxID=3364070 RepID=UPI003821977E
MRHPSSPLRVPFGKAGIWALAGASVAAAATAWWVTDSAPYPYAQHRLLDLPLPFLSWERLAEQLQPLPGERMLEIGPGTGLQSLQVAPRLGADGRLDIVDIQQEMLDHVMRRAAGSGLDTIVPTLADARELPFDDATFDAAYLVTALGEIPDVPAALSELRRVLKPTGRLVVGEFFDRHQIRPATLARHANAVGLHVIRQSGPALAYFALLRPCTSGSDGRPHAGAADRRAATIGS